LIFNAPLDSKIREFDIVIKGIVDPDDDGQMFVQAIQKIKIRVIISDKFSETSYPPMYLTLKAGNSWDVPFTVNSTQKRFL